MELSKRLAYLSFLIIGIIFVLAGIALNELDILVKVDHYKFDEWYNFILPWVVDEENGGLPVPWN